jgi:glucokinase
MLRKASYRTASEPSLLEPARRFLEACAQEGLEGRVDAACVSGAGPVSGDRIVLTNAPWNIDGPALAALLGAPVRLINDFTAVGHGVLLLDPADGEQLIPLPHRDGSTPLPEPQGTVVVVGAGTGLGVGFITRDQHGSRVHPSEGGHLGLPVTSAETLRLWKHLQERYPGPPGAEAAVSGPGIANIFRFLMDARHLESTPEARAIRALPAGERPGAIARAMSDPVCARTMALFVELYARVCADLCAVFLPTGGIFLAGGIAAKNVDRFLEGQRFMASFERNYLPHIDTITRATPVYVVRDYAVSLYGAADAALGLP